MQCPARQSTVGLAAVALAAAAFVLIGAACGSGGAVAPYAADAVPPERALTVVHGASVCGRCVATACARERGGCEAEPECAAYVACADACPSTSIGDIDPACEAACLRPTDPAGGSAEAALTACRTSGPGASCAGCGANTSPYRSPLLRQDCPVPAAPPTAPVLVCTPGTEAVVLACRRCEIERCCDARRACEDSAECTALKECTLVCADVEGKCYAEHDSAVALEAARRACRFVLCAAPCSTKPVNSCSTCINTRCGDEFVSLYGTHDGLLLEECNRHCGPAFEPPCLNACVAKYPSLKQQYSDYQLCAGSRCLEVCGTP